ncbi:beta-ketoacyl synthase chain length factor [Ferribacterium limneticum]|uniref:beta-ketoacyl synthase chain length factor n=1 Tax=Ferribacterium limneticum TaxID=76259 RepID=UPI001CFADE35|nr:beta-ketoacyl synthase chain length factor [Ferribacterium limneticum]UCV28517.1 beta-ketoacyl synthase chain length factor [Ferribacterium limneticum]UCV32434.1 beta-ketoacyl synthase chain length factor [Ferribacterium limneticum]
MSRPLTAWIEGIGFLAPGLPDWPTARAVLRGEQAYESAPSVLPAPSILPPAERRRASRVVKLALAVGLEAAAHAGADVAMLATVFSASGADGHNCHALCEQLATDDRQISPTRFHNSVHNAAAGYWGIATGAMAPCQVLCAYDGSFGAGLIDALGQVALDHQTTLLIAYDSEYPEPLFAKRPVPDVAGVGLLLTPERSERSLASIKLTLSADAAETLADDALETLRVSIPALRALPLLQKLARGEAGEVCLDYLPPMQLKVEIGSC